MNIEGTLQDLIRSNLMGSLTIYFEDEYPRQTIHRNKFVNYLKETLSKEPNAFGENLRVSYTSKERCNYYYKTGRFDMEQMNQFDDLSNNLSAMNFRNKEPFDE
jgi:hypothetical protein